MPVDYTRIFEPEVLMQALGYDEGFDKPEKIRARAAALRGDPSRFENDQQYGLAGMMLRGPTAERLAKTLYTQGATGKRGYEDELAAQTQGGQQARQSALALTMGNLKDKRAAEAKAAEDARAEAHWQAEQRLREAAERRQAAQMGQDAYAAIADPITGEIVLYNKKTGERAGQQGGAPVGPRDPATLPQFNPARGMKPTEKMKNDVTSIQQQRASVQGALDSAKSNPNAFGFTQGALERFGGDVGTALAQWKRNPMDTATRAYVLNNVSTIINERAGAAQSVQELARLRGFLPSETDDAEHVEAKFNAFLDYLDEREAATRGYSTEELGYKPRSHGGAPGGPAAAPAAAGGAGSSRDNPIVLE